MISAARLLAVLTAAEAEESAWQCPPPISDAYGWLPYPVMEYTRLAAVAAEAAAGPLWCEAGAGIGTKLVIAQQLGADPVGVEACARCAAAACARGRRVITGLAADHDWGAWDVVYLNRLSEVPEWPAEEAALIGQLRSGAVLLMVNGAAEPAGWERVDDPAAVSTCGDVRGVWRKP